MKTRRQLWLVLSLVVLAAAAATAPAQELWTARYPLCAGGQVTVANVQGFIRVEGWDRAEVEIVALKNAEEGLGRFPSVEVGVEHSEESVDIRTFYPADGAPAVQMDYL
ncbi:MAG: hypothetical protein HYY26_06350, partial [Acidobacteria bacterium]|nr:hypothetical protein [Acidobacteriota bacterium]